MKLELGGLRDRLRSSLFFVPTAYVIAGIVLGQLTLILDSEIGSQPDLALGLSSTVDSARAVLSTVASATITVAGIAFSVSLLILQLASSQYSPRVVHGLFRDPFNKRVMGIVLGTFTYCLVVLRSVRSPLDDSGSPVIPNVSVSLAVVFGIVSVLAIVAFINHNAHSMDVSEILEVVTNEAIATIEETWVGADQGASPKHADATEPEGRSCVVAFASNGWVQAVDIDALVAATPPHSVVRLDTSVGRYAIKGTPLCTVWPALDDASEVERRTNDAVVLGSSRSSSQDVAYGLRQLADVALKALSPGINDPTTAQDAIFRSGAVLGALQARDTPPQVLDGEDGRQVILAQQPTPSELVDLAFGEVRRAATNQPTVCIYLLETMHLMCEAPDTPHREWADALRREARLVLEGAEHADLLPADLDAVRDAYTKRFGAIVPPPTTVAT
jgi:uncharacterized membrane protein